ncbi:MAG: CPBP family intramembrane metalloprotease [Oscillospiraceae bacterium]|nr:CPBP family intramembrane metalloprotease [Oscillospiraceae bacterium]
MEMVEKQSIFRNVWRSITPIFAYYLCQFVPAMLGAAAVLLYDVFLDINNKTSIWQLYLQETILYVSYIIAGIIYYLSVRKDWEKTEEQLPQYVHKMKPLNLALCVFMLFMGINVLIATLLSITGLSNLLTSDQYNTSNALDGNHLVYFISVVIAAPIVEEMCFRGFVFSRLMSWMKPGVAVVVQALLFGLVHIAPLQIVSASIAGIALGLLYLRYRKLWPCIVGHMAFNFFAASLQFIGVDNIDTVVWYIIIVGVVFTLVGGFLLRKQPAAVPVFIES